MEQQETQVASLKTEATGMMQWATGLVVVTRDDADSALQRLSVIKGLRKKVVDWFAPMKKAAADAHKAIVTREKEVTDVADRAEAVVKQKVLAWQQAEQRKAEAERLRLQAEVDERARRERERLEREAARLKTPEKQEERLQQAAAVVAPVIEVATPALTASGSSLRKTYRAVLLDKAALIRAAAPGSVAETMLAFDARAADAFARATKGASPVPGIRFETVDGLSIRAAV